jgi:glycine cleavage system H protein
MAYVLPMATFPEDLRYSETHEWVRGREKLVTVGITQIAADRLGPIGFVELPYPGDILKAGAVLCRVGGESESMALHMPFTGKMMTTNQLLTSQPGLINSDPYGAGWIVKMEPARAEDVDALLDAAAYEASLSE